MSRIGKLPILLPAGVEATIKDNIVEIKGPKGVLSQEVDPAISVVVEEGQLLVKRPNDNKRNRSLHGLYRSLIQNMVVGVTEGYEKKLRIEGVGYRASKEGKILNLQLGHSHHINMEDPEGITVEVPTNTEIIVKGINRQQVGNYAAKIRSWREPEPYKGKGVRYHDEVVRRKEGKAGK